MISADADGCSTGVARPATVSISILRGALAGISSMAVVCIVIPRELQVVQLPKKLLRPMKAIAVIPARLASTRLERKALCDIAGMPMIGHVYRGVCASPLLDGVIIATDSLEIVEVC